MDTRKERVYSMIVIDYFTRFIVAELITKKANILENTALVEWCGLRYIPETHITGNGKEFQNAKFKGMLKTLELNTT